MAAGRVNVLRGRESCTYISNNEFDHYRNGSSGVGVHRSSNHHVTCKNGRSSTFEDSGSARVEFYGRREDKEQGEFCRDDGEIDDSEKALAPPSKRRKYSPIVCDATEKEVKFFSKNRINEVIVGQSPTCLSPTTCKVTSGGYDDVVVSPVSSTDSSCALPLEHSRSEGNANDAVQSEENHVPGLDIRMSRWATDGYSPRDESDDEYMHVKGASSPESGEFRGGSSGSRKARSSDSEDSGSLHLVQRNINMLDSCRSVFEFEMIKKINEGTYGVVYKAKDKKNGEIVALKKVKMNIERDGFPISSLREINILLSFNHPSIVDVKEVVVDDFDNVFMVMEYMEYDLKGLIGLMKRPFSIGEIKYLIRKLLEGVKYLHDNWILHRDLKTSNILLNKEGELKICDFGLSRQYGSPLKPYTPVVVTLWYRAPELLLGAKEYSTAIDMWSVGCIMAELVAKVPLFMGKSEVEQINKIFQTLGTPDEKVWPGLTQLPGSKGRFVKQPYNLLRKKFPVASFTGSPFLSELGFDLLSKLLTYDPEKRITAEDALLHDWFHEDPLPKFDFQPTSLSQRC